MRNICRLMRPSNPSSRFVLLIFVFLMLQEIRLFRYTYRTKVYPSCQVSGCCRLPVAYHYLNWPVLCSDSVDINILKYIVVGMVRRDPIRIVPRVISSHHPAGVK